MQTTYAVARTAADRIHRQFERYPIPDGSPLGTLPDAVTLSILIDAAFWTSLRREETYTPRISLAFVGREQVPYPLSLATSLSLAPRELTRLAAAVERSGIHLCVWPSEGELRVWGISRQLPALCLVLEIIGPGLLVVKRRSLTEAGKFLNVAVLQGDEIKIIEPQLSSPRRLEALFTTGSDVNVLLQLAVSIRAHGRGGILLVVPAGSEVWKESILNPMAYAVTPVFSRLADLIRMEGSESASRVWEDAMARAVDGIAGLTAVDGATVMTADYDLLAFGAKVVRRRGAPQVSRVVITEPVEGAAPIIADPTHLGGTRHLAAAQFVQDQHDAVSLVASQDGRFTVFGWSESDGMAHAHRIDALLL